MTKSPYKIFLISAESPLSYLLLRYAEQYGASAFLFQEVPSKVEFDRLAPDLLLFTSVAMLESVQEKNQNINALDLPVLICVSMLEEAHAKEIGADACLFHPLTYEDFSAVVTTIRMNHNF